MKTSTITHLQYKFITPEKANYEEGHFYYCEDGQIFMIASFGNFAHYFGAIGQRTMSQFLEKCSRDYLADKIASSHWQSLGRKMTKKNYRRTLLIFDEIKKMLSAECHCTASGCTMTSEGYKCDHCGKLTTFKETFETLKKS